MRIGVIVGRQPDGAFKPLLAGDVGECRRAYKAGKAPGMSEVHYFDTDGSHMRKRISDAPQPKAKAPAKPKARGKG